MDRYERILTLHRLLKAARYPVSLQHLKDELGCSRATLYRDIAFLRDALGAPIESGEGEEAAVRYAPDQGERFELPGLWLTSEELAALLALNELLGRSDPGVLAGALAPFRARIERLLSDHASGRALPIERIRVIASSARKLDQVAFRAVASALPVRADGAKLVGIDASGTKTDRASLTKLESASGTSAFDGSEERVDDARGANAGCWSAVLVDALSVGGTSAAP